MQSREEVENYISDIEVKIEEILNENISLVAPYTPNYSQFYLNVGELLRPVCEYCDEAFHNGDVNEMELFAFTQQILATKKYELWKGLQNIENHNQEQIKSLQKFKMLFGYFSAANPGGKDTIVKLADLEYQFSQETDVEQQDNLFTKITELIGESSTADYLRAKTALEENDLEEALNYANQGRKKFPGNTPLIKLRSEILRKMDEENITEGVRLEPRDKSLIFEHKVINELSAIRRKLDSEDISVDDFFTSIDSYIQEQSQSFDLEKYKGIATTNLNGFGKSSEEVIHFLATAEYLLEKHPLLLDHAPTAVEFCKALEVALKESIFAVFKNNNGVAVATIINPSTREKNLVKYCAGARELTLGEMAFVFQILSLNSNATYRNEPALRNFKTFIQIRLNSTTFDSLKVLLNNNNVSRYRNGAAHTSAFAKSRAEETKQWCYSAINLL
ncbi:MAG: hypothetical protein ACR2N3_15570 [Pyrinomonadaceae bacterium]